MSLKPEAPNTVHIFVSYAREDQPLRDQLLSHLIHQKPQDLTIQLHDHEIGGGGEWRHKVDAYLDTADVILLLVSANYLASDYCYSVEMKRALERSAFGDARVIPIILHPSDWEYAPFSKLKALPADGKPITAHKDTDEALYNVSKDIFRVIEAINPTAPQEVAQNTLKHFFISYTNTDRLWAEWIAWQLEEGGYSTVLQPWNVHAGSNFILEIDRAARTAQRTIAVLSPAYLNARYTQPEWAATFAQDPTGAQKILLPVRVRECEPEDLLGPIAYIDLVGLDEHTARQKLLEGVQTGRAQPAFPPAFPGRVRHALPKQPLFPAVASEASRDVSPLIWNVPYAANPYFTGYEDILDHIYTSLHANNSVAITQALGISGLGGVGKTQVAVEYAHRHSHEYQTILWVKADTRDALIADFVTIANVLNLPERSAQDPHVAITAVKRWLSEHNNWLLIFDNANDLSVLEDAIPPSHPQGHVLLTTRARTLGTLAKIKINTPPPEVGALLLLRRAGIILPHQSLDDVLPAERSCALQISSLMGNLPLALDQAGAYIHENNCTLSDYLQRYRQEQLAVLRESISPEHPLAVASTFMLALRAVGDVAAELLRLCAFLHPEAIPEEIFTDGASELSPRLRDIVTDQFALNTTINTLRDFSLLHRDLDAMTVTIHPLVQAVLKGEMDTDTQQEWATCTVRVVDRAFPEVKDANWQRCQRLLPHAQVCAALIDQWQMEFAEAAQLLSQSGYYLCIRAQYSEAESLLLRALTIEEKTANNALLVADLNRLAELYRIQGKYQQAEQIYQRTLAFSDRTSEGEHPEVAQSLNNLAGLYRDQGKYTQATSLYKQALDVWGRSQGEDGLHQIQSLSNLADVYFEQGKYDQAEPLLQKALEIGEALGTQLEVASIISKLADVYSKQSKYEQAEQLYKQALSLYEETLPEADHPDTARCLNNLAMLYQSQGKYTKAEPLYQQALLIYARQLGADHPDTAASLNNLAELYMHQGRYQEAKQLLQGALSIYETHLGADHPDTAASLNNLAALYDKQGEYTEAEPLYRRALAIYEKQLGATHPEVATCLNSLANLYLHQSKYEEAEQFYRRAIDIYEKTLGPEHPAVAPALNNMARLYQTQGKYEEAVLLYQRVLSILGPHNANRSRVLRSYATVLKQTGRSKEAAEVERQIKLIRAK